LQARQRHHGIGEKVYVRVRRRPVVDAARAPAGSPPRLLGIVLVAVTGRGRRRAGAGGRDGLHQGTGDAEPQRFTAGRAAIRVRSIRLHAGGPRLSPSVPRVRLRDAVPLHAALPFLRGVSVSGPSFLSMPTAREDLPSLDTETGRTTGGSCRAGRTPGEGLG